MVRRQKTRREIATATHVPCSECPILSNIAKCNPRHVTGAYEPAFRKQLRTSYPLAVWVLDITMGKEVESVMDERQSSVQASIFKEEFVSSIAKK